MVMRTSARRACMIWLRLTLILIALILIAHPHCSSSLLILIAHPHCSSSLLILIAHGSWL
jgi:hypothetical protein